MIARDEDEFFAPGFALCGVHHRVGFARERNAHESWEDSRENGQQGEQTHAAPGGTRGVFHDWGGCSGKRVLKLVSRLFLASGGPLEGDEQPVWISPGTEVIS